MKGRSNFQTAYYQRVRAQSASCRRVATCDLADLPTVWQMSWVEETGTIVSIVVRCISSRQRRLLADGAPQIDLGQRTFTTFMTFSKGACRPAVRL